MDYKNGSRFMEIIQTRTIMLGGLQRKTTDLAQANLPRADEGGGVKWVPPYSPHNPPSIFRHPRTPAFAHQHAHGPAPTRRADPRGLRLMPSPGPGPGHGGDSGPSLPLIVPPPLLGEAEACKFWVDFLTNLF